MGAGPIGVPSPQPNPPGYRPQAPAPYPPPVSAPASGAVPPQGAPTDQAAAYLAGAPAYFRVKAPLYSNSMGLRFFGDVEMWFQQGWLTVRGMRAQKGPGGGLMVGGVFLIVIAALALALGLVAAASSDDPRDTPITAAVLAGGAVVMAAGLGLYFPGRSLASRGSVEQIQVHMSRTKGGRVRFDSNLGCLLSLLLSPIGGLIVMLVRGKRIAGIPMPKPEDDRPSALIVRVASDAEGTVLDKILRTA